MLGFRSRFSAVSIVLIMLGATEMVHAKISFFMNWARKQTGEGFEYHLATSRLPIVIAGPGR